MAVPTITTDLTLLDAADTDNGSTWGSNSGKWNAEPDLNLEGSSCIGCSPNSTTGDGGYGFTVTSFNSQTNLVLVWIWVVSSQAVGTKATHGVYIRLATGSDWTSNYEDFDVGGSDVAWCGAGWRLVALDATRTPDRSNGSPTMTAITRVGVGFQFQQTSSKAAIAAFDVMRQGTKFEITAPSFIDGSNGIDFNENGASADTIDRNDGGSWITDGYEADDLILVENAGVGIDGYHTIQSLTASVLTLSVGSFTTSSIADTDAVVSAYCTFDDVYQKDGPTDDNWYGAISKNRDGAIEINYLTLIGDESGGNDAHVVSRGETIWFTDQPLTTSSEITLRTVEDTGVTRFLVGDSSGTGDSRVGFGGSVFNQDDRTFGLDGTLDLDANITLCELYGSKVALEGGASFDATVSTPHKVTNVSFEGCGQITMGRVESRTLTYAGNVSATDAAMLWNANIDIKASRFLANANSTEDAAGVEHDTAGSYNYFGLTFAGNDYDIRNTATAVLEDSYATTNQDTDFDIYESSLDWLGQSFQPGTGGALSSMEFYLRKVGSPTGTMRAHLFALTGTPGTNATPTGTEIATSEDLTIADLTTSFGRIQFEFKDSQPTLSASNYFAVLECEFTSSDASNRVEWGEDSSSPPSDNNVAYGTDGSSWNTSTSEELCYYVNSGGLVVINADSASDPSTYENAGSPPGATKIVNSVTLTVNVKDGDASPPTAIENARVVLSADSGGPTSEGTALISEKTNASGVASDTYNYLGSQPYKLVVRKSSAGEGKRFEDFNGVGTITGDETVNVLLYGDSNVE